MVCCGAGGGGAVEKTFPASGKAKRSKEIVAAISAAKPKTIPKVTIVGAESFVTSLSCTYMDKAERLSAGVVAQGFFMARSADHCDPAREVKISKNPAEVTPLPT